MIGNMEKAKELWLLLNKMDREVAIEKGLFKIEKDKYPYFYLLDWFEKPIDKTLTKVALRSNDRRFFYQTVRDAPAGIQKNQGSNLSQTDLIDLFLLNLPSISRPQKNSDQELEDLSEKNLSELPISETFAKILIKQEKYTEAIEIYHQLILKMPEKKVYFASQIENLQNKLN